MGIETVAPKLKNAQNRNALTTVGTQVDTYIDSLLPDASAGSAWCARTHKADGMRGLGLASAEPRAVRNCGTSVRALLPALDPKCDTSTLTPCSQIRTAGGRRSSGS